MTKFVLFYLRCGDLGALHSFPTRRSSDRPAGGGAVPRRDDQPRLGPLHLAGRHRGPARRARRPRDPGTGGVPAGGVARRAHPGGRGPGLRRAGPPRGRRRTAPVPAVRRTGRPGGSHLRPGPRPAVTPDLAPDGEIVLEARVLPASNATFVGHIGQVKVVYKPVAGERPLWDFPDGTLARREVAAYLLSEAF